KATWPRSESKRTEVFYSSRTTARYAPRPMPARVSARLSSISFAVSSALASPLNAPNTSLKATNAASIELEKKVSRKDGKEAKTQRNLCDFASFASSREIFLLPASDADLALHQTLYLKWHPIRLCGTNEVGVDLEDP